MRHTLLGSLLGSVALITAAHAAPPVNPNVNLVQNGSFEMGTGSAGNVSSFNSWTISNSPAGSGPGNGPEWITYGANATGFGDNVAADPFTNSPDASGSHAAFFVDDAANETLSQSIAVTTGNVYEVGFDFFETNSGANNPNFFSLSASLNGTVLKTITSGATYGAGTWYHVFDVFTATSSGNSGFQFSYLSGGSAAKDVIVDDVYVETAPPADIPEPASFAMLGAGLLALGAFTLRARRFG
jgi:hypothetical protein